MCQDKIRRDILIRKGGELIILRPNQKSGICNSHTGFLYRVKELVPNFPLPHLEEANPPRLVVLLAPDNDSPQWRQSQFPFTHYPYIRGFSDRQNTQRPTMGFQPLGFDFARPISFFCVSAQKDRLAICRGLETCMVPKKRFSWS